MADDLLAKGLQLHKSQVVLTVVCSPGAYAVALAPHAIFFMVRGRQVGKLLLVLTAATFGFLVVVGADQVPSQRAASICVLVTARSPLFQGSRHLCFFSNPYTT